MVTDFDKRVVAQGLKAMFTGTHFNICMVRDAMELLGIQQNEDYRALSALHCVDWGTMPAEFRQEVMDRTLNLLSNAVDTSGVDRLLGLPSAASALPMFEARVLPAPSTIAAPTASVASAPVQLSSALAAPAVDMEELADRVATKLAVQLNLATAQTKRSWWSRVFG